MRIDVLTLFPELFVPFAATSIIGRAVEAGLVAINCVSFRDFARDHHRSVDDRPFGGGPGMVLMCGPVFDAVESVEAEADVEPVRILLTPQGERLTQEIAIELAGAERLLIICGHYEGFDERIRLGLNVREISIGDYVLSGGESAAMVLIDAVVRLLPGALGDESSIQEESFQGGLLEYPQYTRPREFRGMAVPDVLLSGDHARIADWRREQAEARTLKRRPDLLAPRDAEISATSSI
ncbi:MAG: tRNA (guanosine(37)-N1)-methyltransferase TrmD [Planctomycetes bacterium]|nr:tRNA (guanosine(37)-N1)-methyltransferase TrmD [Planctomycetota bacterium]